MAEIAQTEAVETPVAPVAPAPARGRSGKFVAGPGNPDAFNKAVDAAFAEQGALESVATDRKDALLALGTPAEKEQPEEAPEKSEAPAGKTKSDEPEVDTDAVEAGVSALKRLKVPAKLIDGMTKAEIADYGKEAKRQAAEQDSLRRELGELRKASKESTAPKKESAPAEQPFDLEAKLQPLGLVLDEDAGNAVGELFKQTQKHYDTKIAALQAKLDAVLPEIEQSKAARVSKLVDEAKAGLEKRFPQLSDKADFERVLGRMAKLNASGEYSDAAELMLHASKIELDEVAESQTPPQPPRKRAASPLTDTSKLAPGPMTWDKAADLAIAGINKGLSADEIRLQLRR